MRARERETHPTQTHHPQPQKESSKYIPHFHTLQFDTESSTYISFAALWYRWVSFGCVFCVCVLCSRDVEDSTGSDVTPPLEREMEGSAGRLDHRVPER